MIPAVFFPEKIQRRWISQGILIGEPERHQPFSDEQAMRLAIQEAYRGLGFVSPNPLVGCVVLDSQNRFLSKGFHARYGEAHAEVNALRGLSTEELRGARVFVTLEPCAHQGQTPSCAKALAQLPVGEVIYGIVDPNPLVSGQGAAILRQAGVAVRLFGALQAKLEEVCEHFLWNFHEKKIFVSGKIASSLDGQLALASGESQWITDETSREVAHLLRAAHDAILVGANTVRTDNPSLNVRSSHFHNRKTKIFVLDSDALCLAKVYELKIAQVHDPRDVTFVISDHITSPPNHWGAQILRLPAKGFGLDLGLFLTKCWEMGLRSLLVEGGAHVLSSFISEKKLQRLYLFQAPMILGAKGGKAWSEQVKIENMSQKILLKNRQFLPLDQDLLVTGQLE